MKINVFLLFTITVILTAYGAVECKDLVIRSGEPILLTSDASDRSTAYTMSNKIITSDVDGVQRTYFVYSKIDTTVPLEKYKSLSSWIAVYNNKTNRIENETFLGYQYDNHGSPAVTIDNSGYLHVVFGPHGDSPLQYRKSLKPYDITSWEPIENITTGFSNSYGEITYPVIKVDSKGNVHIAGSANSNAVYINNEGGYWHVPQIIMTATKGFARYNVCMDIDRLDRIHILVPDTEFVNGEKDITTNTDLYYFVSTNLGKTFSKSEHVWNTNDGYAYYNTLALDMNGNPHFTMIERHDNAKKNMWHVYYDRGKWIRNKIEITGMDIWEAKISIDNFDNIFIIIQASEHASDYPASEGWNHITNALYLAYSKKSDINSEINFSINKIVESNKNTVWLPTIQENQRYSHYNRNLWIMWNVGKHDNGSNLVPNKNYIMQLTY